jgi:carbon monoxide dehydrogenase subunit G
MPKLHLTVVVPRPVSEVYSTMADFRTLPEWDPGSESSVQVAGDGPAVGAEYDVTVLFLGRASKMRYRTVALDPDRRVVFTGEGATVTATDEIGFRTTEAGTEIDYRADIRLKGLFRLVEPFLGKVFSRLADATAAGIERRFS